MESNDQALHNPYLGGHWDRAPLGLSGPGGRPLPPSDNVPKPVVYFVRHGDTAWNDERERRLRGHVDVPLNAKGREAAERAAEWFAAHACPWLILAGPLSRTWDTGEAVADATGVPMIEAPAAKTWNTGDLDGKPSKAVDPLIAWFIDNPDEEIPGGESYGTFLAKWIPFVRSLMTAAKADPSRQFVVATHHANLLALKGMLNGQLRVQHDKEIAPPGGIIALYPLPKPHIKLVFAQS